MTRILVVEDSPTQAVAISLVLEKAGFDVTQTPDAEQALELLRGSPFELVITDILLPGETGYELCRRVKADPSLADVQVVLLTMLNSPVDILRGIECGADSYVTKPFQPETLLGRVRLTLANRAHRAENDPHVSVRGETFAITSGRRQVLDLLVATCEEMIRTNQELVASQRELREAKAKLEGEARSLREKYWLLMDQAQDAIFLLDTQRRILEVNRQVEKLLGRPAGEMVGRRYDVLLPESERDNAKARFEKLLAQGQLRWDNSTVHRPDGSVVRVDCSATVVELDGERLILAVVRDVTEHHSLERQLRQAQKMEAVGRLAAGIAHDFNNLLTVINGYSELLLVRLPPGDPTREVIEQMFVAGERAAGLTSQLMAFSRQQVLEPRVVALGEVVRQAEQLLRRLVGADVELEVRAEERGGMVRVDQVQIEQVLMNLAANARDAMPRGGKLTIETREVDLEEAVWQAQMEGRPGRYVVLVVSDTGQGMTEEVMARIFDPFFTTKEKGKGTGLGLATVYAIVQQWKGHVSVSSEVGRGTVFRVYLPRTEDAAAIPRPVSLSAQGRVTRGGETVLVAEDEESVRVLIKHVLTGLGYKVLEACDGEEALRIFRDHQGQVHLVVSDVVMPRLGGLGMAQQMECDHSKAKILFLSGYVGDSAGRLGEQVAEVAFLQKPFTPAVLARKVRELLDS